jgi:hypothetical protein
MSLLREKNNEKSMSLKVKIGYSFDRYKMGDDINGSLKKNL